MSDPDHYQILGVSRFATSKQIKDRYRVLCHAYHPDKFSSTDHKSAAEDEFKRINEAYAILSDENRRRSYDADYVARERKAEARSAIAVLERLTHFSAPPYPWWEALGYRTLNDVDEVMRMLKTRLQPQQMQRVRTLTQHETYDVRVIFKDPVPPTKIDTFICDLWTLMKIDLGLGATKPGELTPDDVRKAVRIYEQTQWKKIRGNRSWTHWNFVNGLASEEREILASEAYAYMLAYGIRRGEQTIS
jgi:hypothetical protein